MSANRIEAALRALESIADNLFAEPIEPGDKFGELGKRIIAQVTALRQTEAAPSPPKECCGNYNYNGDCCGRYVATTNSAPVESSLVVGPADSSQGEPETGVSDSSLYTAALEMKGRGMASVEISVLFERAREIDALFASTTPPPAKWYDEQNSNVEEVSGMGAGSGQGARGVVGCEG